MKIIPFLIVISAGIAGLYLNKPAQDEINPVLGNESSEVLFGQDIPTDLSEKQRIQIHLSYVEKILLEQDASHLSTELQENRKKAIDLLNTYWQNGEFPANYDYQNERKPCFRDKNNQICAVGFLVQQTGHEDLVKSIEATENYAAIYEMTNPDLADWVAQSGLTLKECAMIQPTYGTPTYYNENYVPAGYAISSSALSGIGLSASLISLNNLKTPQKNGWIIPAIGMASGLGQITLGAINYRDSWSWYGYPSKRNENVSLFNIAFGTFTTAFNTYALIQQLRGKKARKDLSLNVFGYQSPNDDIAVGFNLVKRF